VRRLLGIIAIAALAGCGAEDDAPMDLDGGLTTAPDARMSSTSPGAGSSGADAASTAGPDARANLPGVDGGAASDAGTVAQPGVRFVGRIDRSDPAGPRFTWSGTAVLARFTGPSIGVRLRDSGNRFEVLLDGMPLAPLVAASGKELYPLASNLGAGTHELALYRRTEAFVGETQWLGLALDPAGALLAPPPPPARRLEFVGDSITCGYGVDGPNMSCPFSPDTENHFVTAGAIAARTLGADAITVAYSGKGVWRNYGGDMMDTVPSVYDRVLVERTTPRWDFTSWTPDAVIINLGTNDFAQGDPGAPFQDAYTAFVRRVRGNYPGARIVCALGPMLTADQVVKARGYVQAAITSIGDARISTLEYAMQDGSTGFGCDWHPSRATNQLMADRLTAELRRLLGW
jgi:lysophospholipase L1-like esterase